MSLISFSDKPVTLDIMLIGIPDISKFLAIDIFLLPFSYPILKPYSKPSS